MGTLGSSLHESKKEVLKLNWSQVLIFTLNDHVYNWDKIPRRLIKQPTCSNFRFLIIFLDVQKEYIYIL